MSCGKNAICHRWKAVSYALPFLMAVPP
jgi:hypothetical protein